jgi:hypothetical protein
MCPTTIYINTEGMGNTLMSIFESKTTDSKDKYS